MVEDDSVIEPGEKGYISKVIVVNEGKMPSPKHSNIVI